MAKPRARDLGIPFEGTPGPLNAITDVGGVEVGMTTLIEGEGVRTGVTAILPRGQASSDPVFAGWFSLNGNGEMTGTTWIDEAGLLDSPVLITNTHSVGIVRDAAIAWAVNRRYLEAGWGLPVVAETFDGSLNDINGFHVKAEHVFSALDGAKGGPVAEGNVGGGTGMIAYGFKAGTGTASRRVPDAPWTVGVLVQANHGGPRLLRIAGVPVGAELANERDASRSKSIIIVVATDAPLLPHQLKRVAKRATHGLARTGAISSDSSGDIFIAFSTANPGVASTKPVARVDMLSNAHISAIFQSTVEATEEAIVNSLVAAETMKGVRGTVCEAIPHERVVEILRKYGRAEPV